MRGNANYEKAKRTCYPGCMHAKWCIVCSFEAVFYEQLV